MTLFKKHKNTLDKALEEIKNRGFWSPYFEIPSSKVYGAGKKEESIKNFKEQLNNKFEIKGLESRFRITKIYRERSISLWF